ncbi:Disintegrin and metalloproteinase domain-containing protein 12 [Eumeta japonica]|uniref:Disintegrin and metalloproteinase domain-containing protein 12 n=1 Tax=Eumeta variegata TaxID=151549 RepID=A0A4C1SVP4_EUMVA|nr:Disintegrin and metalloproteinase domain-containing protein 12 [Eumeta japonica]
MCGGKGREERQVRRCGAPSLDFDRYEIVKPIIQHARTKREISSTKNESRAVANLATAQNGPVPSVKYRTHTEYRREVAAFPVAFSPLSESSSGPFPPHSDLVVIVNIEGKEHILDLRLNEELIPDNHVLKYQKNGKGVLHKPKKEDFEVCQYSGKLKGVKNSWAAVSTCHGIRGTIYDGSTLRYIEPKDGQDHYVYAHKDLKTNFHCGYTGGVTKNATYDKQLYKDLKRDSSRRQSRISRYKRETAEDTQVRGPYNSNKLSRYVELVLVADHREFIANGESLQTVYHQLKDVANIINSVYAPLNIFIALVGVVVWNDRDEIQLEENGDTTLTNFLHYRKLRLLKDIPNDNAQLLTRQTFKDGVVGKALKGPICTYEFSGGVSTNHSEVLGLVATTIAHEMGHNFGMEHDNEEDCDCPDEKCIMSPSSTSVTPIHWSSCSLKSLALAFERGMDYCLRNKPRSLFDSPTCGNGFVEPGEECDCGKQADDSRTTCEACCHPDTCRLRSNATCATGLCCDLNTCKPKSAGTLCRSADQECDLPEYCTGYSEYCPSDVFKMDSTPCDQDKAFCVSGSCRSHADQCRLLWGTTGQRSHDNCYDQMNIRGNKNGNCGYDRVNQKFVACSAEHAMCGLLHCQHLNEQLEFGMESVSTLSHTFINNNGVILPCRTAIIDLGLSQVDPGMVPDGAKCGEEKMCLNQRCVPIAEVRSAVKRKSSSVCPSDCSGHGVCNSEGQCHCESGFGPPLCAVPGPGGSISSGPATDPTVQRNFMVAMYIIFLGIIPAILLGLLLMYYSKHNMVFWWKKPRKSYVNFFSCVRLRSSKTQRNEPHESRKFECFKIKRPKFKKQTSSLRRLLSSFRRSDRVARNDSTDRQRNYCNDTSVVIKISRDDSVPKSDNASVAIKTNRQEDTHIYDNISTTISTAQLQALKIPKPPQKPKPKIDRRTWIGSQKSTKQHETKRKIKKEDINTVHGECSTNTSHLENVKTTKTPSVFNKKPEIIKTGLASTTNSILQSPKDSLQRRLSRGASKFAANFQNNSNQGPGAPGTVVPASPDDMSSSLLRSDSDHSPSGNVNSTVNFFGNFKGFSLAPIEKKRSTKDNVSSVAIISSNNDTKNVIDNNKSAKITPVHRSSSNSQNLMNQGVLKPVLRTAPPLPVVPTAAKGSPKSSPSVKRTNSSVQDRIKALIGTDKSENVPTSIVINPPVRPVISSPILEASTCTAKELISPLQGSKTLGPICAAPTLPPEQSDLPKRPVSMHSSTSVPQKPLPEEPKKVKEGISLNRIASFLKQEKPKEKERNAVERSNSLPKNSIHQVKLPKTVDKVALRNLQISNPILQKDIDLPVNTVPVVSDSEDAEDPKAFINRSQSMRGPTVMQKPAIQSFGSMRQPRPLSTVGRPTAPPPPLPNNHDKEPQNSDYERPKASADIKPEDYVDCVESSPAQLSHIAEESSDNIYAIIEELPQKSIAPVRTAPQPPPEGYNAPKPITSSSGSTESMGLLGEIVSEIQNRNLDSIYSAATLARRKKEREKQEKLESERDNMYVNTDDYKAAESVYSNSDTKSSAASTTSSGYLHPSAVNVPTFNRDKTAEENSESKEKAPPSPTLKVSNSKIPTFSRQTTPPGLKNTTTFRNVPASPKNVTKAAAKTLTNSPDLVSSCAVTDTKVTKPPDVINNNKTQHEPPKPKPAPAAKPADNRPPSRPAPAVDKKPVVKNVTSLKPVGQTKPSLNPTLAQDKTVNLIRTNSKTDSNVKTIADNLNKNKPKTVPKPAVISVQRTDSMPTKTITPKLAARPSNVASLQQKFENRKSFGRETTVKK